MPGPGVHIAIAAHIAMESLGSLWRKKNAYSCDGQMGGQLPQVSRFAESYHGQVKSAL